MRGRRSDPVKPEFFSPGIRKHDAAGVEFVQQLAQFRVGE
jgi:hypothetical protein